LHQHSVAAAHSFYASKVICSGEGGAITTNDPIIAERARLYRGQGASTPGKYWHSVIGYNYRMTELQAAIGLAQIEQIADILAKRRAIINRYIDQLPADPLIKPQGGYRTSGWLMAVQLPDLSPTIAIAEKMARDGIETRPFFTPLPALPMYGGFTEDQGGWRVAFAAARRGICLPTHTKMNFADVDLVVDSLERALGAA
jgi:perosamine synthetase